MDASIHFKINDLDMLLCALSAEFDAVNEFHFNSNSIPELFDVFFNSLPRDFGDRDLASATEAFSCLRKNVELAARADASAVIVVRNDFLSLYWDDVIRADSLKELCVEFCEKTGQPAFGTAIVDSSFYLFACSGESECHILLTFDGFAADLSAAADFCDVLGIVGREASFLSLFSLKTAGDVFSTLKEEFGFDLYLTAEDCVQRGYALRGKLDRAVIFNA